MKYFNSKYKLFESEINNIIEKCKKYKIKKYDIDDDGLLTVFGDVNLSNMSPKEIPLKFKVVCGDFDISYNSIASLFGSPIIVGGSFICSYTKIRNLKHAPIEIGHNFNISGNKELIEISNFPKHVGCGVMMWNCKKLKSLYGCLKFINSDININNCCALRTLKYSPHKVLESYSCLNCNLKSLYGAPKYVGNRFNCSNNKITSLKYSPRYIGGIFMFNNNYISSFDYFPDYVGGDMYCENNPVYNVWKLFKDKGYIEYFNQLKIISSDGKIINVKRLNIFLYSIGKESVKSVEGYKNV